MVKHMRDISRYARQIALPEVGPNGQARLSKAHVLVVGAGGLGCPVLQYLAGAGVGTLTVIDPDHVEESNLHRQPLYTMQDLGRPKVAAAAHRLMNTNPEVEVIPLMTRLTPANAADMVSRADIVIDAADSFAVSYILSDTCLSQHTPLVSASALGQSGYVGAFCDRAPSLRAVFPDLPEQAATCTSAGVLGPLVGMIGSLQAHIALQLLLDHIPSPLGTLLSMDLASLRLSRIDFSSATEPAQIFPFLAVHDLQTTDLIIELRNADEAPRPANPDARRLSISDLPQISPSDRRVVLCCTSGLRAWRAARHMQANGHYDIALFAAGAA